MSAAEVREALPIGDAIDAMSRAFSSLLPSSGSPSTMPTRSVLPLVPDGDLLVMPCSSGAAPASGAALGDGQGAACSVKMVTVKPNNRHHGHKAIHGLVCSFDGWGRPVGLLEGGALTAIRTGAASGLATRLLARQDADVVAVIGVGVQARTQLEAVCAVRPIREVRAYARSPDALERFSAEMASLLRVPVVRCGSSREALRGALVVCCATSSRTPVFHDADLEPGAHVNACGNYKLENDGEVPVDTVKRALVVVDDLHSALEEAGELVRPIRAGAIPQSHIERTVAEVEAGHKAGRTSRDQITLFKSVGLAVQDMFAAEVCLENARKRGLGTVVAL